MSVNNDSVAAIREQAARWIAQLSEGEPGAAALEELHRWLEADARHAHEFRAHLAVAALATGLSGSVRLPLQADAHDDVHDDIAAVTAGGAAAGTARRRRVVIGLAAAVAAMAVTGVWLLGSVPLPADTHVTDTGEVQTVSFEDGSVAYLNTRTRLRWIGGDTDRRVELLQGEALFDVAHDPQRPFRVMAGNGEVRVLGTRFNVYRRGDGEVRVTVIDGSVEVCEHDPRDGQPAWSRKLAANQQLAFSSIGLTRDVRSVNALNVVKWREGVLELTDEPLAEVLDELTRYTDQRILIKDPRLAQLRLGGALSTRDVRAALARIEKLAPIAVTENGGTFTLDYRN
jgi:transmembrane sensor